MFIRLITAVSVIFLAFNPLIAETHVGGEMEGGVWTSDGSPYIVDEVVEFVDSSELIIEPGVVIRFTPYTGIFGRDIRITAEGTDDDSIYFIPDGENIWACLQLPGRNSTASFSFCYFFGSFGWWEEQGSINEVYGSLDVRHCTFRHLGTGITVYGVNYNIEDCVFEDIVFGAIVNRIEDDSTIVRRCVFKNLTDAIGFETLNGYADHCIFNNVALAFYGGRDNSRILNSIFTDCSCAISGYPNFINNNCFNDIDRLFQREELAGVGVIDRINNNGDSTDAFGNLFLDPHFIGEGNYPECYHLQEDSPCIDAGDPESPPDPDSTRADIGAFFYHRRNICILPDTLVFGEMAKAADTLDLVIRNLGQLNLEIITHWIEPVGSTFRLVSDEEDNFVIEPESDHIMSIEFAPPERGDYRAIINFIANDLEDETVAVPLIGSALDVKDFLILHPSSFILFPASPNPFNSTTSITFQIASPARVSLAVYDLNGRLVEVMIDEQMAGGIHTVSWQPETLASGLYFVRLEAGGMAQTRKIVLMR